MALVQLVQFKTLGFPGAPGYTTLAFSGGTIGGETGPFSAVFDFINAIRAQEPNVWSAQIAADSQVLDVATGVLDHITPCPAEFSGVIQGASGNGFGAGVAGLCFAWSTALVNRGRKVRGRTFLVPVQSGAFEGNGTLEGAGLANMLTAGNALSQNAAGFGIWSRPRLHVGGAFGKATGVRIHDQAAFLSSRRN